MNKACFFIIVFVSLSLQVAGSEERVIELANDRSLCLVILKVKYVCNAALSVAYHFDTFRRNILVRPREQGKDGNP